MAGTMMRMLVIVGVLLCSLQFCEPASAHFADRDVGFSLDGDDGKQKPLEPAKKIAHSGHHHCPMAPDLRQTASEASPILTCGPLFSAPVVQRPSRELPPLLDPPLA